MNIVHTLCTMLNNMQEWLRYPLVWSCDRMNLKKSQAVTLRLRPEQSMLFYSITQMRCIGVMFVVDKFEKNLNIAEHAVVNNVKAINA